LVLNVLRLGIQLIWTSDVQQALSSKDSAAWFSSERLSPTSPRKGATNIATEDHEYDAKVGYFGCPIL